MCFHLRNITIKLKVYEIQYFVYVYVHMFFPLHILFFSECVLSRRASFSPRHLEQESNPGKFIVTAPTQPQHNPNLTQLVGFDTEMTLHTNLKSSHVWGQSHLKPDIQRSVLSAEPLLGIFAGRDI